MNSGRNYDAEDIPVREPKIRKEMKSALNRQSILKMDRTELEDRYMTLYDENIVLKKYGRKRDEEIKRLSAIQLRLENDRKKLMLDSNGKRLPESHYIEQIEQLQDRVCQLEKANENMRMKVAVLKQQTVVPPTSNSMYSYVGSKVDTGIVKQIDPRIVKNIRMIVQPKQSKISRSSQQQRRMSQSQISIPKQLQQQQPFFDDDASQNYPEPPVNQNMVDKAELDYIINENAKKFEEYERTIMALKEQIQLTENEHNKEMSYLKSKLNDDQKNTVQENVERIKLERELKEKNMTFQQLHDQYSDLMNKMHELKRTNEKAVDEIGRLVGQVKNEQSRVIDLQQQLEANKRDRVSNSEFEIRIADLERECAILKESNSRLMNDAMQGGDRDLDWKKKETSLRIQIAQLEAAMKSDVGDKGVILEKLAQEREQNDKIMIEYRDIKLKYLDLKQKYNILHEQAGIFDDNGLITNTDFIEAMTIVKQKKDSKEGATNNNNLPQLDFVQKVDDEIKGENLEQRVKLLQAEHTETINELEKTRNLLIVQYKINKDYQAELDTVSKKAEEMKREYNSQLDKYAQLLDIRAERIRKLESQLKDIAYGTKQYKLDMDYITSGANQHDDVDVVLENGQNMFEIHIKSVMLTEDSLRLLNDTKPQMFCTWEFYDFELQSTPVLQGPRMDYEFTSQYIIEVDDFFIHYLHKDSCLLELHQCFGSDYNTVATGKIQLKGVLERATGRLHGTLYLQGTQDGQMHVTYGVVEYWVRLLVPMEQALRLYKERSKALGYIESNTKQQQPPLKPLDEEAAKRPSDNINNLTILIKSCSNVQAINCTTRQPSPYVIYRFFDFPDHDSSIIQSSNNPIFNDQNVYPVAMTTQLHQYLLSQSLVIYIFDDTDPRLNVYLGVVTVPLVSLANNQSVKGQFEVITKEGKPNGVMDLSMSWQYSYMSKMSQETPSSMPASSTSLIQSVKTQHRQKQVLKKQHRQVSDDKLSPESQKSLAVRKQQQQQQEEEQQEEQQQQQRQQQQQKQLEQQQSLQQPQIEKQLRNAVSGSDKLMRNDDYDDISSLGTPPWSPKLASTAASPDNDNKSPTIKSSPSSRSKLKSQKYGDQDEVGSTAMSVDGGDVDEGGSGGSGGSGGRDGGGGSGRNGGGGKDSGGGGGRNGGGGKDGGGGGRNGMDEDSRTTSSPSIGAKLKPNGGDDDLRENKTRGKKLSASPSSTHSRESAGVDVVSPNSMKFFDDVNEPDDPCTRVSGKVMRSQTSTESKNGKSHKSLQRDTNGSKQSNNTDLSFDDVRDKNGADYGDEFDDYGGDNQVNNNNNNNNNKKKNVNNKNNKNKDKKNGRNSFDVDETLGSTLSTQPSTSKNFHKRSVDLDDDDGDDGKDHADEHDDDNDDKRDDDNDDERDDNQVTITISHVRLTSDSPVMEDDKVQMLYVAYEFLGEPPEETETPYSLPKPTNPNDSIFFNFTKVFKVGGESNTTRRRNLEEMMSDGHPSRGRIRFTLISEPKDDDCDCEDVGVAYVNLHDILNRKRDFVDEEIAIQADSNDSSIVGHLGLTIECYNTLKNLLQHNKPDRA